MIQVEGLTGGYGKRKIVENLAFHVRKGEFFALLGPNGSGKTTIFKLLTGQLPVQKGTILLDGQPLSSYSKLAKAKKVAVLSQESHITFDFTVEEIVRLGRYPHQSGFLKQMTASDWDIIEQVMEVAQVTAFRKAQFRLLSGGEKQRVLLAKALAQEPELLLLDEPTNHLDIQHTFQMLDLLKTWQQEKSLTILSILHDLNVASLYADRVALLHKGQFLEVGDINTLRKEAQLQKVYEVEVKAQAHPVVAKPQLLLTPSVRQRVPTIDFSEAIKIVEEEEYCLIMSALPLRTLSNAEIGSGIQWMTSYCFIANDHFSQHTLQRVVEKYHIPLEQTVGISCVHGGTFIRSSQCLVGISLVLLCFTGQQRHVVVIADTYFNDQQLFDCLLAVAEAKARTQQLFSTTSKLSNRVVFGATQRRKQITVDDEILVQFKQQLQQLIVSELSRGISDREEN